MSITLFKGNLSPSISDTISIDGAAVNLTGASVKFRMRAEDSSTLKVDAAAVIVNAAAGQVRYDPVSADVDTAGDYFAWWQVTFAGGKIQDTPEFEVFILEHAPVPSEYVTAEELKDTLSLGGKNFADADIDQAIEAAGRAIDEYCGRRFRPDLDANQVRYYSATSGDQLWIDDLIQLTSLQSDPGGDNTFDYTWTLNTDFVLEPRNAAAEGKPYESVRRLRSGAYLFPTDFADAVKITGKFGWASPPAQVKEATTILASRLFKRARDAPFGVITFGAESVARITRVDPDVQLLLQPFTRWRPFV